MASATAAFLAAGKLAQDKYGLDPTSLHQTVLDKARNLWHHANPARPYVVRVAVSTWEALWAPFEGDNPNLVILREWIPQYRQQSWQSALAAFNIDDPAFAQELAKEFIVQRRQRHIVYPEVQSVLKTLQRSYPLGLITNGLSCLQRFKIEQSGLGHFFQATVITADIGTRKPEPAAFETILERLNVRADQALMVGNSVGGDIGGAQAVGMKAILIDRGELHDVRPEVIPDAVIHSLDELLTII